MAMFEPRPRKGRPPWLWPLIALGAGALCIVLALFAGGPWLLLIILGMLIWAFFGVRFLISDRGKKIAFGRFDERYEPPEPR
ncbi:MAG: hypothetical protein ABR600_14110 [Actinomycetota bacterium]